MNVVNSCHTLCPSIVLLVLAFDWSVFVFFALISDFTLEEDDIEDKSELYGRFLEVLDRIISLSISILVVDC